jgi:hypothetical protein
VGQTERRWGTAVAGPSAQYRADHMQPMPDCHIHVVLVLKSGLRHTFEVPDEVVDDLEVLMGQNLPPSLVCSTWLRAPPTDRPAYLRVFGRRRDGREVLIELNCTDG